jgi:hypothetical protein
MADLLEDYLGILPQKKKPVLFSPADELGSSSNAQYQVESVAPQISPEVAPAFPVIPIAPSAPQVKTAAELQGRDAGQLPQQFVDREQQDMDRIKSSSFETEKKINELFGNVKPPKFDDLQEDLRFKNDYSGDDLMKGALIAALPTVLGGLFGGLAGAAGASKGGELGAKMFVENKELYGKQRRDVAEKEAKRRIDLYKDESAAASRRANVLVNRMNAEMMMTGRISDATRAIAKDIFGTDTKQALEAQKASGEFEQKSQRMAMDSEIAAQKIDLAVKNQEITQKQAELKMKELHDQFIANQERLGKDTADRLAAMKYSIDEGIKSKNDLQSSTQKFQKEMEDLRAGHAKELESLRNAGKVAVVKAKPARGSGEKSESNLIPGFDHDPSVSVDKTELRAMRDAVAESKTLSGLIARIKEKVKNTSNFDLANPWSDASKSIHQDITEAQLKYKGPAFAQLGVLAGPDMDILQGVIENPGHPKNLYSEEAKNKLVGRYDEFINKMNQNIQNKLEIRGFTPSKKSSQVSPKDKAAIEFVKNPANSSHPNFENIKNVLKNKGLL